MNIPYKILRTAEIAVAAFHFLTLRLIYGPKRLRGPMFGHGRGLRLRIRNGGSVRFGKVIARDSLSVFCDGGSIVIGDRAFFNNHCSLNSMLSLTIGEHTLLGEGVRIYDHDHALDERNLPIKDKFKCQAVSIGANCWIGSNVTILKGVSLCDGVVIGSGAVVSKSIDRPGTYVAKDLARLTRIEAPTSTPGQHPHLSCPALTYPIAGHIN